MFSRYRAHSRIATTQPWLDQALQKSSGPLRCGGSTSQQMEYEEHYADDEEDVNESSGNVECEKSK
jgi:hypothetical protein